MGHDDDVETRESPWSVADTVERLTAAMSARGMTIFAVIDQRAAARGAGQDLRDTTLIIFGNPAVGTAIMDFEPLAGLDLPLKALVWDAEGTTRVSFLPSSVLATRYSLRDELVAPLGGVSRLIDATLAGAESDAGPAEGHSTAT